MNTGYEESQHSLWASETVGCCRTVTLLSFELLAHILLQIRKITLAKGKLGHSFTSIAKHQNRHEVMDLQALELW